MNFKEYYSPETNNCFINNITEKEWQDQKNKLSLNALREEYEYCLTEEDLEQIGMSLNEYLHPTEETVKKIEEYLKEKLGHTR